MIAAGGVHPFVGIASKSLVISARTSSFSNRTLRPAFDFIPCLEDEDDNVPASERAPALPGVCARSKKRGHPWLNVGIIR